ncbi:MAG TPA: efflux RND transporter permease subunit [Bryobacteraceae bacterium]|nr:efflux RND transporter permease subunit [Bryobacteraceae bacterium]
MWIVRLALRRPYTFVVAALVIALLGGISIVRMPADIFPEINIPVVSVIFSYSGMAPEEMERRIVTIAERAYTTTVNDIEHQESQSVFGFSHIKIFFRPDARIEAAVAQINAQSNSILRVLPPGIFPPNILRYNAASVPVLQISISSDKLSEQELNDYGTNFIRTQLATVQGASVPLPYGGKYRQVMVDLDPQALYAHRLSATDVSNAIGLQNLIIPAGTAKMGERDYSVRLNSSPEAIDDLNRLPVKQVEGATVYVGDVAQVRDGYAVQTNVVRENGRRSALISVLKSGGASTLDIVERVKKALPRIQATLPRELKMRYLFDQSIFVRASLNSVVREAVLDAFLTALMILLFLGSWRSTVVVATSIPLSILASIIVLNFTNQTLNVMTLGGLALAVGILVDDATVAIENIHRNMAEGKPIKRAILDGSQQIAVAAFVSTLSICIVFVPVVFLSGSAKWLFTPLAAAVVFAMMASYLLSRTLVPTMVWYLLRGEVEKHVRVNGLPDHASAGFFRAIHLRFERGFEGMRDGYRGMLDWALSHRRVVVAAFVVFCGGSALLLTPMIGEDFFPVVDAGQFRLHVRAPAGTRLEQTERYFSQVEAAIRRSIPPGELALVLDNIGVPVGGINLAYADISTVGPADGEILVSLKENHAPTWGYVRELRRSLREQFPDLTFFFQPSDIISQILNFGLPAPIDVQIAGRNVRPNYELAREIKAQIERIPGAVDVHMHQVVNGPELRVQVDRTRAEQMGLTQRDVANSLLISLSSSGQVSPSFWLNPRNSVSYNLAVQTPQARMNSIEALGNTPISATGAAAPQLLTNVATIERRTAMSVINHNNVQPVFDVYANVQNSDLGAVASEVNKIVERSRGKLARGSFIEVRGQVESMRTSFVGLGFGLVFAVVLVYFLMVVNFQSWIDPLIIMMALPGALSGILWMLFITGTTISVPSLMGAIMSIGVATANSILLVTFANDHRAGGAGAREAALEAGYVRLRPVVMTALAMIIGMLPMSVGLGEGGEQNAPLGRAVIGGLVLATFATLFFVPVIYSLLRKKQPLPVDREEY